MKGTYLGPEFKDNEIEDILKTCGAIYKNIQKKLIEEVAKLLAEGNAVGWMQGRMEFGPRALGARSILVKAT